MSTILMVDDDEPFRCGASSFLADAGYTILVASQPIEALSYLDSPVPIDLLVTDLRMPDGYPSGVALGVMAKIRRPGLPVIFITACPELAEGAPVRAATLLCKPIYMAVLTTAIRATLAASALLV